MPLELTVNDTDPLAPVTVPASPEPLNCRPRLFSVIDAFPVMAVVVPAYPAALIDSPEVFAVHVMFVPAVFRPRAFVAAPGAAIEILMPALFSVSVAFVAP